MKKIFNTLLRYFFQGLLIIVPGVVTVYVILRAMQAVDSILPIGIPGLGSIIILAIIITIGAIGSSIFIKPFLNYFDEKLEKTPGIKIIYSSIKDLMNAFVGKEKKFNKPVLVMTNPAAEIEEMGFITNEDLSDFQIKDKVAVYMPHSYAFSGKLLFVPKQHVKIIDAKSGDTMKFIVTGGVADVGEE